MDLTCAELVSENNLDKNVAEVDRMMMSDPRVIKNLLHLERSTSIQLDYFKHIQTDIEPVMRRVVAVWMMEVCDEQHCEGQVFPLAINYMDRFLSVCSIRRTQFQLLGSTCLLLASKIRQCHSLSADLLSAYTDCSVTPSQMRQFELLLLTKLQWNLSAITGFDYVDHLLERLSWGTENFRIRQHAHTLVTVCLTELRFMQTLPSVLACACICSAARGLKLQSSAFVLHDVCGLTQIEPSKIEFTAINIEHFIAKENESILRQQQMQQQQALQTQTCSKAAQQSYSHTSKYSPSDDGYVSGQPETPTDIQDVYF